jgi:Protein of unknown function (DUF3551)
MTLSFKSTVVSILVRSVAYAAIATPASAHTYEYCLRDAESFAQSCDFDTLAQCQATASGRGGDCSDPFLNDTSGVHAYAPIRTPAWAAPNKNN